MNYEQPWSHAPLRRVRRGHFWVPGERVSQSGRGYQRAPMYVEWEASEHVIRPYPIILMHGGGFQGTEWFDTPDGRPGWAQRLVEAGYATLVIDRAGHGRSPLHTDITGAMGPPFSYESAREIYFPGTDPRHTQWPFAVDDEGALDDFVAGYGPLPADLCASQTMDADRIATLLDRIGPAILLTHSASGPEGWLVADRRPSLVRSIIAIEPMGPPFATIPNIGQMTWGVAAAPLAFEPPVQDATILQASAPGTYRLPSLTDVPILIVTAEASAFAAASPPTAAFLNDAGGSATVMHLPDHGVYGNGHGLIYERNSDAALAPVLAWLASNTEVSA